MLLFTCVTLFLVIHAVHGYPQYRDQIPNGNKVPNPCNTSQIWAGVGHKNPLGAGERNPFGLDFAANGRNWTQALCNKDSDGDGRSNGLELGDPDCLWNVSGTFQPNATGLSHPGVCEPADSANCIEKNSGWFQCSNNKNDSCSALLEQPGVFYKDYRIPTVNLTEDYTMHWCVYVNLTSDRKYHIIGGLPLIDNVEVIHHILFFACSEGDVQPHDKPWECPVPPCYQLIAGYGYGMSTTCFPEKFGIPIGAGFATRAIMQIHYTNMQHLSGIRDSSGMRIYYTPNLRPSDGGVILAGQFYMDIPPKEPAHVETGYCPKECTNLVAPTGVNITDIYLHMHLTGIWMNVTHYRGGAVYKVLVNEAFNYETPQRIYLKEEEVLLPGDEIRVDCVFDTRSRTNVTRFGEGTNDEMCVAVPTYYPANHFLPICSQWKTYAVCNNYFVVPGCNMTALIIILQSLQSPSFQSCNILLGCGEPCVANLVTAMGATGCFERDIPDFLAFALQRYSSQAKQLIELIRTCYNLSRLTTTTAKSAATGVISFQFLHCFHLLSLLVVLKLLHFRH